MQRGVISYAQVRALTRVATPANEAALWRALLARDRTCRFPGCTSRRCDAHHVEHWLDGGPTSLDNLAVKQRLKLRPTC